MRNQSYGYYTTHFQFTLIKNNLSDMESKGSQLFWTEKVWPGPGSDRKIFNSHNMIPHEITMSYKIFDKTVTLMLSDFTLILH